MYCYGYCSLAWAHLSPSFRSLLTLHALFLPWLPFILSQSAGILTCPFLSVSLNTPVLLAGEVFPSVSNCGWVLHCQVPLGPYSQLPHWQIPCDHLSLPCSSCQVLPSLLQWCQHHSSHKNHRHTFYSPLTFFSKNQYNCLLNIKYLVHLSHQCLGEHFVISSWITGIAFHTLHVQ